MPFSFSTLFLTYFFLMGLSILKCMSLDAVFKSQIILSYVLLRADGADDAMDTAAACTHHLLVDPLIVHLAPHPSQWIRANMSAIKIWILESLANDSCVASFPDFHDTDLVAMALRRGSWMGAGENE
jgi:hypothetical protein